MDYTPLLVVASGLFCLSGVMAYALTRRYGWRFAAVMPVMSVLVLVAVLWQNGSGGIGSVAPLALWCLAASSPIVAGTVVGILVARRRSR